MTDNKNRYKFMEPVLNRLSGQFIALSDDEVKIYNEILSEVVNNVVSKLKKNNPLFAKMYSTVFYGGSFYDRLRVANPEEFDLDLLLTLPKYAGPELIVCNNMPGFIQLRLNNFDGWMRQPEALPGYKNLVNLLDDEHFIDTGKVRSWMESSMQTTLNQFEKRNGKYIIQARGETFTASFKKKGPAFTLKIISTETDRKMDIDFVPCFYFTAAQWPENGIRANPVPSKPNFFLVPKEPRENSIGNKARYWRMSFQEQERALISRKQKLKPAIRLLKKMRDTLDHNAIASYYIKTVALWMADDTKNDGIWNGSLSYIFITVLKKYQQFLEQRRIPYFWYERYNLVEKLNPATLDNFSRKLKAIIADVEKNPNEPETIVKYLLGDDDEYNPFLFEDLRNSEIPEPVAISLCDHDKSQVTSDKSSCILC